jgi:hypothetical protein
MGHHRQIQKDGSFYTTQKGTEDSGALGKNIRLRNLEVPRHTNRHYIRLQLPFHIDQIEAFPQYPWDTTPNKYVFPSTNKWSDRKNQPNDRGIPTVIHKL